MDLCFFVSIGETIIYCGLWGLFMCVVSLCSCMGLIILVQELFLVQMHDASFLKSVKVKVTQSCLIFCDPMDFSLPGSSVHGILQVRILEWVAVPFSRGSSQPRD